MTTATMEPGEIHCLDDCLAKEDCALLLEGLRFMWWWNSELSYIGRDGKLASATSIRRTSSTSSEEWMDKDMRALLRRLEWRLSRSLGLAASRLEIWQAVRYRRGQRFDEHHDAGFFAASPAGERTHSVVLYLEDHDRGGSIVFPALRRRFRPRAGRLLVWRNLLDDGSVDQRMRHAGSPALQTKTILTTWARQRPIRSGDIGRYAPCQSSPMKNAWSARS